MEGEDGVSHASQRSELSRNKPRSLCLSSFSSPGRKDSRVPLLITD